MKRLRIHMAPACPFLSILFSIFCATCLLFLLPMSSASLQGPLDAETEGPLLTAQPKRMAIVGGGIAGVSLAHFLRKHQDKQAPLEVKIFERDTHLGGRIHSIHTYDGEGRDIVNLGAHTFDADDALINGLAQDADVELRDQYPNVLGAPLSQVSVWNGEKFIFQQLERVILTWEAFKRVVRQNLESRRFWDQLVVDVKGIWNAGWDYAKWVTLANHGPGHNVLAEFARIWGLNVRPQRIVGEVPGMCQCKRGSCRRGEIRAFLEKLVQMAEASIHFNSTVTRIVRREDGRYDVHWTAESTGGPEGAQAEHFDAVVLAHAFGQTDIQFDPSLNSVPKKVEYTPIHVTHFVSRKPLDPATFNLPADAVVPDVLWNVDNFSRAADLTDGLPPFLTLTRTTRYYSNGCLFLNENVYRVTSPQFFSDSDIAALLDKFGIARETVTFPDQACSPPRADGAPPLHVAEREDLKIINDDFGVIALDLNSDISSDGAVWDIPRTQGWSCDSPVVRWLHRHHWPNGLPVAEDSSAQEDGQLQLELAPRLFYTSAFESRGEASVSKSVASALAVPNRVLSTWKS